MLMLALGLGVLAVLLWAARSFSRASVSTLKSFGAWAAALAGLSLATMLLLTGRGPAAISGVVLFGPMLWQWWKRDASARPVGSASARPGPMTREEALSILGLTDPVSEAEIREAWLRLMRATHPDKGGSDWLASRVNQAKDVLLRKK